jgi:hypothetical protein
MSPSGALWRRRAISGDAAASQPNFNAKRPNTLVRLDTLTMFSARVAAGGAPASAAKSA